MYSGHGLPSHPSLPIAPHLRQQQNSSGPPHYAPTYTLHPAYAGYQPSVASHYAQAYMQYSPYASQQVSWDTSSGSGHLYGQQASTSKFQPPNPAAARWYQPGTVRCTKPGCMFMGSKKAVETHMMDRHLIYPPGWETRKRKDDWDADPSLKGYSSVIKSCVPMLTISRCQEVNTYPRYYDQAGHPGNDRAVDC